MIILDLLQKNGGLSRSSIATSLDVSDATIKRDIAILQELGVISRKGAKKNGIWIVNRNT